LDFLSHFWAFLSKEKKLPKKSIGAQNKYLALFPLFSEIFSRDFFIACFLGFARGVQKRNNRYFTQKYLSATQPPKKTCLGLLATSFTKQITSPLAGAQGAHDNTAHSRRPSPACCGSVGAEHSEGAFLDGADSQFGRQSTQSAE
jgi:hypothetical protein